uniref:Integrase, catalytic region, zinc finger, CCHC-type, peptidase aspartic, catalytic n=1 Tax=Tanacetum cinerariifolium TaxID=118510 RepID=A0A6L2NCK3_TANCI|nr:hypothetical protein [Tanacetum cinerariifolium]
MDSIIPLGQKNTLAEYMILSDADYRPPMLDKDLYDSWKSQMELNMQNREHERMILESVENGLLIKPTIEANGGLPSDIYSLVNHHRVAKDLWEKFQLLMQGASLIKQEREFQPAYPYQSQMNHQTLSVLQINNQSPQVTTQPMTESPLIDSGFAIQVDMQRLLNVTIVKTEDLDTYDSGCDDLSNVQAVLTANIFNYDSDVISEVPHSEIYLNDMDNQSELAMQDFEQRQAVDSTDNEIHSDSNIIPYSKYLQETQQKNVQDTHLQAQQDAMILSVIEQMLEQMISHVNNWKKVIL